MEGFKTPPPTSKAGTWSSAVQRDKDDPFKRPSPLEANKEQQEDPLAERDIELPDLPTPVSNNEGDKNHDDVVIKEKNPSVGSVPLQTVTNGRPSFPQLKRKEPVRQQAKKSPTKATEALPKATKATPVPAKVVRSPDGMLVLPNGSKLTPVAAPPPPGSTVLACQVVRTFSNDKKKRKLVPVEVQDSLSSELSKNVGRPIQININLPVTPLAPKKHQVGGHRQLMAHLF